MNNMKKVSLTYKITNQHQPLNACNLQKTARNWMVYMNAFYVPAAPLLVLLIGGTQISTWAQLLYYRATASLSISEILPLKNVLLTFPTHLVSFAAVVS